MAATSSGRVLRLSALAAAMLLVAGCGNLVAPSMGSPSETASAPANPNMGQVVNGAYIVAPGDTLASVSNRTNTPIRALIDNNELQPPYNIRPGQELRISTRQTYVVKGGDTLGGLARRFRVQQSALVELNGLKPPYKLQVGQSLVLPSAVEASQSASNGAALPASTTPQIPAPKVDVVPEASNAGSVSATALPPPPGSTTAPASTPAASQPGAKPLSPAPGSTSSLPLPPPTTVPDVPTKTVPAEPDLTAAEEAVEGAYEKATQPQPTPPQATPPAAKPVAAPQVASVAPASAAGFSWPVQGKVILKYGATSDGLRNDGINIAAPAGAPVMAAADGTVAYAGNQLRGFGNLVLIRHANGLITAYAHNESLLVQKGDKVTRGKVIARVGSTGNVAKPQLHFEIRKGEEPVDPMKYLDGGA
ncbi:MAG: peptidoglycan DD-metalloendopeptidase family protein [Rhodospirillaceae bacterium]|nr:peptidoglycan DD-metalloendopeptidase family protein [Rhodospirillaceae bacterium]